MSERRPASDFGLTEREVFDIHYAMGVARRTVIPDNVGLHGTADHAEAKALILSARAALHRIGLLVNP